MALERTKEVFTPKRYRFTRHRADMNNYLRHTVYTVTVRDVSDETGVAQHGKW